MKTTAQLRYETQKVAASTTKGKTTTNPLQLISGPGEEELLQKKKNPLQLAAQEEEPLQMKQNPLQLAAPEEEPLQMKQNPLQLAAPEEEPLQMKQNPLQLAAPEEEPLQMKQNPLQLAAPEEEPLQMKQNPLQLAAPEEEPLQMKQNPLQLAAPEEEALQMKQNPLQLAAPEEEALQMKQNPLQLAAPEEEPLQMKPNPFQLIAGPPVQKKENKTGLPDQLKSGVENLSGYAMDDVKVHYNSSQPAQLNALAYAQGTDIHVAPGQEKHLPHEAWHVVQQKQGRVQPTVQMKGGVAVNDDRGLENEADLMGAKALGATAQLKRNLQDGSTPGVASAVQLKKTAKPDSELKYDGLINAIGKDVKQNVLTGKITKKDQSDAIWDEGVKVFNANIGKGAGYMANINAAITKYKNTVVPPGDGAKSPKQDLIDENTVKRTEYNKKFRENYAHAPIEDLGGANKYRVNTKGYDPADLAKAKPVVSQGEWTGDYSNEVDFTNNSITAKWNMAGNMKNSDWTLDRYTDEALKAGKGLNNSEILWQQYKMAAEEKYKASGTKDTDVAAALKRMSRIKRDTVINAETLVTVYMAYDEGKNWQDDAKDFMPGSDEFNAVAATPNAKSSIFMLIDHMDEIEKTVEKISASTGGLDIVFGAI